MATKTINTILNLKDQFSNKLRAVGNQTKTQSRQMRMLDNNVSAFKSSAVSSFTTVAKHATVTAAAFIGINTAIDTVKGGMDFMKEYQGSMSNLQATTGATAQELAQMKDDITTLYKKGLGESINDLSQSMATARQFTGQTGEQLKKTTELAVTYRDTFGEEVNESLKAADTMMKNFGISSEQAFNLLAKGAQKGLDKSKELLDTSNEYSVYFRNLGFTAGEMFDIFGAGLENGAFNLDKVGDAVKEFQIRAKDMSKASLEAFQDLNMDGEKMSQTFAAGGEGAKAAFKEVVNAIGSLDDPVKANTIGVALFGTQFEDMEKTVITSLANARDEFRSTDNVMQEINKIKYNNVSQAFTGIGRLVETNVLMPIADKVLPKLSEFGQWFYDNTPAIETSINKAFSVGLAVVDEFGKGLGWAKDNASWLTPAITGLTTAILAQKAISGVIGMYKAWKLVTEGMTIAQIALNIATKASPFGWVAMAIGLLVTAGVYLWQNWDTVKAKGMELWASLTSTWTNIKESITSAVSGISGWLDSFPLGQAFLTNLTNIISGVKQIFGGVVDFVAGVFTGDWSRAWEGITNIFKGQFNLLAAYAKAPINVVIGLINTISDTINGLNIKIPDWVPMFGGKSFEINIPKIPQFGLGTSYFSGGLAQINERNGGEIVNLPNGSQVIPADKSEKMIDGSRENLVIQVTIQGNVIGTEAFVHEIGSEFYRQVALALNNRK